MMMMMTMIIGPKFSNTLYVFFHDNDRWWLLHKNGCSTQTRATFRSSRL